MADSNSNTPRGSDFKTGAIPFMGRRVTSGKLDIITARHTQALAVLATITADLTSGESVLSEEVIASSLWAVEALIEQAQAAANSL